MIASTNQTGKRATYPAYKPSGVEWLGGILEHRRVRRLKYSASFNDKASPETTGMCADVVWLFCKNIPSRPLDEIELAVKRLEREIAEMLRACLSAGREVTV